MATPQGQSLSKPLHLFPELSSPHCPRLATGDRGARGSRTRAPETAGPNNLPPLPPWCFSRVSCSSKQTLTRSPTLSAMWGNYWKTRRDFRCRHGFVTAQEFCTCDTYCQQCPTLQGKLEESSSGTEDNPEWTTMQRPSSHSPRSPSTQQTLALPLEVGREPGISDRLSY